MRYINSLFISLVILLAGCTTPEVSTIPNFAVVSDGVFRGGQPTDRGWWQLRLAGVTNVVKLNLPDASDGGDDTGALQQGMVVHRFPIDFPKQLFGPVPKDKIDAAVACVGPGTFLHCAHGQDRTGIAIAVYRMRHDGWTKERAEKEMLEHGFHKVLHGLWDFWEDEIK